MPIFPARNIAKIAGGSRRRFRDVRFPIVAPRGHGRSERVVEASIQRMKIGGADFYLLLDDQLGDRLADVTIVMHDLVDREAECEQVVTVQRRGLRDVRVRWRRRAFASMDHDTDASLQIFGQPRWQLGDRGSRTGRRTDHYDVPRDRFRVDRDRHVRLDHTT